jgi:CMP-N,N'-diacetyllegionaminic acid synthase
MILAIIPARGGSKGIPRKNLQPVTGVPLVVHTIRHALEAALVDRVVVSTDDDEIAAVSAAQGVEVIQRPLEISGDTASSESALLHALDVLSARGEVAPELVVFLQATSPIRRPSDIDGAVRLLLEQGYDSVFSASVAHGFVWEARDDGVVPLDYEPGARPMRQQIGEREMENGSIYVLRPRILRETGVRLGGNIGIYRMGYLEGLQIDEPEDLELARWILERWSHEMLRNNSTSVLET